MAFSAVKEREHYKAGIEVLQSAKVKEKEFIQKLKTYNAELIGSYSIWPDIARRNIKYAKNMAVSM